MIEKIDDDIIISDELSNFKNYNWDKLSKRYETILLFYSEYFHSLAKKKTKDFLVTVDVESEFNNLSSYNLIQLQSKYEFALLEIQNFDIKNMSKASANEFQAQKIILDEEGLIKLTPKQLINIRDSLKRKKEIVQDLSVRIKKYAKTNEKLSSENENLTQKIETMQSEFYNNLDITLKKTINETNSDEEYIKINKQEYEDLISRNASLLKQNMDLTSKNQVYFDNFKKHNITEKLSSKENEEKFSIIKELSKILKSSKFDEDLIKRLQKQIKLNYSLLSRISDYEKIHNQINDYSMNDNDKEFINFLRMILPDIDLFRNSLPSELNNIDEKAKIWIKGFQMVYGKIWNDILSSNIIAIIPTIGTTFDPTIHEPIELVDEKNFNKDEVVFVGSYGFKYKNVLIMPAKVKINK